MKKIASTILTVALFVGLFSINSCNKDDDKDLNTIIIAGNSNDGWNGTYTPEEAYNFGYYQLDCEGTFYSYSARINFTNGGSIGIKLVTTTAIEGLPLGTFEVSDMYCASGFNCWFSPTAPMKKVADYILESGTVKLAKTGDIYEVDFNCVIEGENGGGTLKGNFKGMVEIVLNK